MNPIRLFLWLVYEANKYGMNLYWLVYLRWYYDGNLILFAHIMGVISFVLMISNIVYALSGSEV